MKDSEAFEMIAKRVEELVERDDVKVQMVKIANENGKQEAENWVYQLAIATLLGV